MDFELKEKCRGKKFFVTGGSGFIGSEVVRQISSFGGSIIVYDNFSSGKKKYLKDPFILPKKPTSRQPFHKLNIGQSIYWVRGFFRAQTAPNIDTLSAFGCVQVGGFEAYEN